MVKFGAALIASALGFFVFTEGNPVAYLTGNDISRVIGQPSQYEGKLVTVTGKVVNSVGIIGFGAYTLRQGDAEITIVSARGVPPQGAKITTTGLVKQAVAINNIHCIVIIEAGAMEIAHRIFRSIQKQL